MVNRGPTQIGANPTMTKADLVEEVTKLGDLTRRDSETIVETIFDSVIGALRSGDKIEIRGFGSFRIRQRKPGSAGEQVSVIQAEHGAALLGEPWRQDGSSCPGFGRRHARVEGPARNDSHFPLAVLLALPLALLLAHL